MNDGSSTAVRFGGLLAFVAFFLISAGWAFALPPNGTNDEDQHVRRAYAVASGQVYSPPADAVRGGGAWFDLPRTLLPRNPNCTHRDREPASCQISVQGDDRVFERTGSAAGRYNPLYYAPVGLPLLISPDTTGIIGSRLVSGALTAACLAAAVSVAVRRRSLLLVSGIVLAATPNLLNLGGSVNPSGLENAAAILVWTALIALVRPRDDGPDGNTVRRLLVLAAIGSGTLLTLRTLGPLLLALIVLACAALAPRGTTARLLRRRDTRWIVAALAGTAVYAAAWTLFSGVLSNPPQPGAPRYLSMGKRLGTISSDRLTEWTSQVIGRFSYGEVTVPNALLVSWFCLAAVLVVPTLLFATRRERTVVVGAGAGTLALLVAFELAYVGVIGWTQQSRYFLPFGVGTVLVAAALPHVGRALGTRATSSLVRLIGVGTALMHLWALAVVMSRFSVGQNEPLAPFGGEWSPAAGPYVPFTLAVAGVVVLAGLLWTLAHPQPDDHLLRQGDPPSGTGAASVHPVSPAVVPVPSRGRRVGARTGPDREPVPVGSLRRAVAVRR